MRNLNSLDGVERSKSGQRRNEHIPQHSPPPPPESLPVLTQFVACVLVLVALTSCLSFSLRSWCVVSIYLLDVWKYVGLGNRRPT
jgi:hypothetical protein